METALKLTEPKSFELAPGIIPEWEAPKEIVLVWPERLRSGVSKLKPFYKAFINQLSAFVPVRLIASPELDKELLLSFFDRPSMITINHINVSDIWLRDYMPLAQRPKDNRCVLKPLYAPSYLKDRSEIYAVDGNNSAIIFSDLLGYQVNIPQNEFGVPLILDGSNFVTNGKDIAICSNRLITDNETWSLEQLHEVFNRTFGISKLIFIPAEPGNVKAHASNLVRFIDEQNAVVADYPDGYLKQFTDEIARRLNTHQIEVHRVMQVRQETKKEAKYQNTTGNFVNYLRLGNVLFLPEYEGLITEFERASAVYRSFGFHIIPVPFSNDLAEAGAGLNHITWNAY